jgi:hypothetical protein
VYEKSGLKLFNVGNRGVYGECCQNDWIVMMSKMHFDKGVVVDLLPWYCESADDASAG